MDGSGGSGGRELGAGSWVGSEAGWGAGLGLGC